MQYLATAQTDVGIVKQVNQDSLTIQIADTNYGEVVLVVVCDGMGGLKLGEVASANVIDAFQEWFHGTLPYILANPFQKEDIQRSWLDITAEINEKIIRYGQQQQVTLGTTLTAMLFIGDQYYVLHVGDCRIYQITDRLIQVTQDQTFIAREIAAGRMTPEQGKVDSRRNILLQCIGVNQNVCPEFFVGTVQKDATYLLCTDGFRHEITEQEIFTYCNPSVNKQVESMNYNLRYLIELNKSRQERDNISAVLIRSGE